MDNVPATKAPRQRRPRKKPERFCNLSMGAPTGACILVIRQVFPSGKQTVDAYTLEPIPADHGPGLLLHKHDGSSYAVCLSGPDSSCDCPGHEQHGHCKHVESLLALQQAGRL